MFHLIYHLLWITILWIINNKSFFLIKIKKCIWIGLYNEKKIKLKFENEIQCHGKNLQYLYIVVIDILTIFFFFILATLSVQICF